MTVLHIDDDLLLRRYHVEDIDEIFNLIDQNRNHLSKHGEDISEKYPTTESVTLSITQPENPERQRFGIWHDSELVGTINLTRVEGDKFRMGYYLCGSHTSKGFATRSIRCTVKYAFEELGAQRIFSKMNVTNFESRNVLYRSGFAAKSYFAKHPEVPNQVTYRINRQTYDQLYTKKETE